MEAWSVDEVCKWLVEKNLGELVPRFQEEEVSGAALLALNDRMIQQLVKKIGHQAVLLDFIKKYKQSNQWLKPTGGPRETSLLTLAQATPEPLTKEFANRFATIELHDSFRVSHKIWNTVTERWRNRAENSWCQIKARRHEENSSPTGYGGQTSLYPGENLDNGLIDQRVLKQRRNSKHVLARHKALQWTKSYILPEFPYDVKCMLAEQKCPDHSMRIRIIEFLQADMTKYLEGSLYPTTQQYNDVVNALLQAHPFLDEDGCGFFLWKRALKDRFKYVRRPIEDDEQVMRNKCKFGHRRGQRRKSLAGTRSDEVKVVQIKEESVYLDSEVDEHIHWFQREFMKTDKDWREIDRRMSQTLEIRRKMIDCRAPLKDILTMFPFLKCPYQMFREVQLLTRTDIYKKTRHILESYSENILTAFSLVDNPISTALQEKMKHYTDEGVLKYMKMTATCLLLPDVFGDDPSLFVVVNEKVHASTPVLEVKNPFHINGCEFSLYLDKEKLAKVDDCVTALAALVAAFRVFGIECPRRLSQTFNFLETLIFDAQSPCFPSLKEKEIRSQLPIT